MTTTAARRSRSGPYPGRTSGLRGFACTQARVQARFAELPVEADWQRMSGMRGLPAWLEEARDGALKPWAKGFSAQSDSADIERGVRALFIETVDDTARLVPGPWHAAVTWCRWLAALPLFDHLRRGMPPPPWMAGDWLLAALLMPAASSDQASRGDLAPAAEPCRPAVDPDRLHALGVTPLLAPPTGADVDLAACWRREWLARWPRISGADADRLVRLVERVEAHRISFAAASPGQTWPLRRRLREALRLEFHRHLLQPAGTFLYLALVGLDLERLRRALLDRALYPADTLTPRPDPDSPGAAPTPSAGVTRATSHPGNS